MEITKDLGAEFLKTVAPRISSCPITSREVASLTHKSWDNSMKNAAHEVQSLAGLAWSNRRKFFQVSPALYRSGLDDSNPNRWANLGYQVKSVDAS